MAMQNVSQVSNTLARKPKPITPGGLDAAMARRPRLNANSRRATPGVAPAPSVSPALPPRLAGLAAKDPAAAQARYAGFLTRKQPPPAPAAPPAGPTSMGPGGSGFESPPIVAPPVDLVREPMMSEPMPDGGFTAQAFKPDAMAAQAVPGAGGPGLPPEILQRIAALRNGGMAPGAPMGGVPGGIHGVIDPATAGTTSTPWIATGGDPNQSPQWAGIPGSPMGGKAPIPTLGAYGRPGIGPRPMQF